MITARGPSAAVLAAVAWALGGCGHGASTTPPPLPSNVPSDAPSRAVVTDAPPAAVDCSGPDRQRYGTTCCDVRRSMNGERYPGEVFLDCQGPQVGRPCRAKGDCDIACSCDPRDQPLSPGAGPQGPADGTRGATGTCAARLAVGVWMCEIDEHGVVGHTIID